MFEGSLLKIVDDSHGLVDNYPITLNDHREDITCMRLFPRKEIFPAVTLTKDNILVTSSSDHTIRLWEKGHPIGCFSGLAPVSALSDRLLGDTDGALLASGGTVGNIQLWSLNSLQNSDLVPLKSTLWGHRGAVKLISSLGNSSLVSVSGAFEMRIWDVAVAGISSCVDVLQAEPVGLKCDESLIYMAVGSSLLAIDSRCMQRGFKAETGEPKVHSFGTLLSKSLVCMGGTNKALLWDIRRMQQGGPIKSVAVLEKINGPVHFLHMDPYRIVVGGPEDPYVHAYEAETGRRTNSMNFRVTPGGCSAMAVNGYRIAIASSDLGVVHLRDFTNAENPSQPNDPAIDSEMSNEEDGVGDSDGDGEGDGDGDGDGDQNGN
ncbi:hypothetical protein RJ641_022821 [Dillenia turbinata]|uniref:Uncharacterized protein n=1 Tax=Dillenia turbinata TaxID=194707 RepID=A0AAN8UD81_9MAGN